VARTALITGANRGIGLAIARRLAQEGLEVILTARNADAGSAAAADLQADGLAVQVQRLDVADEESVAECAAALAGTDIDVLVNNAGVLLDRGGTLDVTEEILATTLDVNVAGPLRTARAFLPGMIERGYGRVVNVSSGAGAICGDVSEYAPAYSVSKTAFNMLTRKLAVTAEAADVKVNAMCPGWVRTDMGGSGAPRSPEEPAETALWLATLPADGPSGGLFRDRKRIPW
jgi:NAD(P)-dependent dehydrogenase (short-subunit alcohol dehydrogenase family)